MPAPSRYKRFETYRDKGSGSLTCLTGTVISVEDSDRRIISAVVDVDSPNEIKKVILDLRDLELMLANIEAIKQWEQETGKSMEHMKYHPIQPGDTIEVLARRLYTRTDKYGNIKRDVTKPIAFATGRSRKKKQSYFREYAWLAYLRKKKKPKQKAGQPEGESALEPARGI